MHRKIQRHLSRIAMFLACSSCSNVFADTNAMFSFNAPRDCRKPPTSPSDKTLYKHYNIYMHFGAWKIYDINGDGWCDWVRGGNEGYRTDIDEPKMYDFIYLGTPKGWRYFDRLNTKENSDLKKNDQSFK